MHFSNSYIFFKFIHFSNSCIFQIHAFFKFSRITYFLQNSVLFLKLPCFLKNSPFKVHSGIPRLTICKKSRFSVQDLGFRLSNMIQTHNRMVIDQFSILFFRNQSKISVYLHQFKFQKKRST